ncbi:hypothetical protein V6N13_101029 [Hibiscus sabdariffa]|uniref:glutathione transferase n=1 Tax=Hibiscus sabdariffa TaxID=183260 RepID=A0ABR2QKC5_9ROSI
MADSNVKVLGAWPSPFVMRVRVALHLKSVDYENIEENLLEAKTELLLKSNPVHKKVPVWSSTPPILPSDPYERADSRFWAAYVDDKFFPALRRVLLGPTEEDQKAAMAEVLEGVVVLEEAFKKLSKGKAFFGGDNLGYVDLAAGSLLAWIEVIEKFTGTKLLSEAKTPSLVTWADCFSSHAAVKDVFPDVDKLADFGMKFRAEILKAAATATTTN